MTDQLTSSQTFAALSVILHRLEAVVRSLEKRDWLWGGVAMVCLVIMTVLAWKVSVLQSTITGLKCVGY